MPLRSAGSERCHQHEGGDQGKSAATHVNNSLSPTGVWWPAQVHRHYSWMDRRRSASVEDNPEGDGRGECVPVNLVGVAALINTTPQHLLVPERSEQQLPSTRVGPAPRHR